MNFSGKFMKKPDNFDANVGRRSKLLKELGHFAVLQQLEYTKFESRVEDSSYQGTRCIRSTHQRGTCKCWNWAMWQFAYNHYSILIWIYRNIPCSKDSIVCWSRIGWANMILNCSWCILYKVSANSNKLVAPDSRKHRTWPLAGSMHPIWYQ